MSKPVSAAVLVAFLAAACGGEFPAAAPTCGSLEVLATQAQALPTAEEIPCLEEVPFGWTVTTFRAKSGQAGFHLSHAIAGSDVVTVTLTERCVSPVDGEQMELEPGKDQQRVHARSDSKFEADRFQAIDGGCIVTTFAFVTEGWGAPFEQIDPMLLTVSRDELTRRLLDESGGILDLDRSHDEAAAGSSPPRQSLR